MSIPAFISSECGDALNYYFNFIVRRFFQATLMYLISEQFISFISLVQLLLLMMISTPQRACSLLN